ncbi:hypothetical protein [Paenibacillus jilunlii]|uniref:hypothetical protein n=1 Tax=Paenibacillus jilunlii TaxID=682956 RepID=UPI001471C8BC|nr:hypothetical protein [Paenibacillus jilunlii]
MSQQRIFNRTEEQPYSGLPVFNHKKKIWKKFQMTAYAPARAGAWPPKYKKYIHTYLSKPSFAILYISEKS